MKMSLTTIFRSILAPKYITALPCLTQIRDYAVPDNTRHSSTVQSRYTNVHKLNSSKQGIFSIRNLHTTTLNLSIFNLDTKLEEIDTRLKNLDEVNTLLKNVNDKLEEISNTTEENFHIVLARIREIENQCKLLDDKVNLLNTSSNDSDNESTEKPESKDYKSKRILIQNIPKTSPLPSEILVSRIADILGVKLEKDDIDKLYHSLGYQGKYTVTVKFRSHEVRNRWLERMKHRRMIRGSEIDPTFPASASIYMNESVPKKVLDLFVRAQKLSYKYNYNYCVAETDYITIKKDDNQKEIVIRTLAELQELERREEQKNKR